MGTDTTARKILVLGASGLIGRFVTDDLRIRGFHTFGVARHFEPSQKVSAFDLATGFPVRVWSVIAFTLQDEVGTDVVRRRAGSLIFSRRFSIHL